MTGPNKEFGFSGSKRIARHLFACAACLLLVTGPALGAPAASDTNGAVASGLQQSVPPSVRAKLWLDLTDAVDRNKFERIWQCMQFLGAPVDFAEAVNICAPCVSASGRIGAAALTEQERSCINRRRGKGGGQGTHSAGDGKYDATANPQCSAGNPGPRAEAGQENSIQETLKNLLSAEHRTNEAALDLYDAERAADEAHRRVANRLEELGTSLAPGEDPELARLEAAARAADRVVHWRRGALRTAVRLENYTRHLYEQALARHRDPTVDPTGQDLPGTDGEDPRCAGKRRAAAWGVPWSDICRGEDGHLVDFKECRRRMTDRIYTASGGRCWTEPGPDDATRTVCRGDTPSGDNAGNTPPCENAEPGGSCLNEPNDRRQATPNGGGGIGPVPDPIKPFLDQMCAKGRCPDPAPFNGPVGRGSSGNAGASNTMPPAPSGQALGLRGLKLAPPATTRFLPHALKGTGGQQGNLRRSLRAPSYGQGPRLRQFGPAPALRTHLLQQSPNISRGLQRMTGMPKLNLVKPSIR